MSTSPAVSVIIPTFRRLPLLQRCLRALIKQDFDEEQFEIIVCDDDPGREVEIYCSHLKASARVSLTYIPCTSFHGPAAARNAGVANARGAILAFTDDDCIPDPDWLREGCALFGNKTIAAVTGKVLVPITKRPTDYELNESGLASAEFVTANLFCRKTAFLEAGGFDTSFKTAWREDSDLHFRFLKLGSRIVHSKKALVCHPVRPAGWGVSLLQQRKALFEALLFKKHPELYRLKITGIPWMYYSIILTFTCGMLLLLGGQSAGGRAVLALWMAQSLYFAARRLRRTSKSLKHITEMIATSFLIPFLSIYWRIRGALTYRVWFA